MREVMSEKVRYGSPGRAPTICLIAGIAAFPLLSGAFMASWSGVMGAACLIFIFFLGLGYRLNALRRDVVRFRKELVELNTSLEEARELVRVALKCIAEGVIVTDAEGRIFLMNSHAREITGYPGDQVAGKDIREVMNPVSLNSGKPDILKKVYRCGGDIDISREDIIILGKDNTPCNISCRCSSLKNGNGETRGVIIAFSDVTRQRRYEEEMVRS